MVEAQSDTTTEVERLFIGEGTKAMLAIAEAMEKMTERGEQIPPQLVEAFKELTGVVKTAVDHVLPISPARPDVFDDFKASF